MKRTVITYVIAIFIILFSYKSVICQENNNILINDIEKNDINVKLLDIDVRNENLTIDKIYKGYAVLTMDVKNNGKNDIELSNIDIYPYQGNENIKYFVSTSSEDIKGFIGNLKPNESKIIKMGVALSNIEENIKLEFLNIEDSTQTKTIESISIK